LSCAQIKKFVLEADETAVHQIALHIAQIMEAVHAAGYMNRDLKPDNILLTKGFYPILLDWGLAADVTCDTPVYDPKVGTNR
jgi:serine/threonine protein kinase